MSPRPRDLSRGNARPTGELYRVTLWSHASLPGPFSRLLSPSAQGCDGWDKSDAFPEQSGRSRREAVRVLRHALSSRIRTSMVTDCPFLPCDGVAETIVKVDPTGQACQVPNDSADDCLEEDRDSE